MRAIIRVPVGLRLLRQDGDVSAASAACVTGCDRARRSEAARVEKFLRPPVLTRARSKRVQLTPGSWAQ